MDVTSVYCENKRRRAYKKLALFFSFFFIACAIQLNIVKAVENDKEYLNDFNCPVVTGEIELQLIFEKSVETNSEFFPQVITWWDDEAYECEYFIEYPGLCVIRV